MIIHAVSEEQKKMQAQHIVSGCVCKNCKYFEQDCFGNRKCKNNFNRPVYRTNFCSDFQRKPNKSIAKSAPHG